MLRRALLCVLAMVLPHAGAGEAAVGDPASTAPPDLAALIECRGDLERFQFLAPALEDPLRAVAQGWRPLPQVNLFMTEFVLASPISVFGNATSHVAFSGDSVLAIIDLPDPRPLARRLELETGIDTPAKAMFGKEVHSAEVADPQTGEVLIESRVLAVSNVASHPGKTLVGCSYSRDSQAEPEPPGPVPGMDAAAP